METVHPTAHPHARKNKKYTYLQLRQMAIIAAFILITTLISVLLPIFFFNQGLAGS